MKLDDKNVDVLLNFDPKFRPLQKLAPQRMTFHPCHSDPRWKNGKKRGVFLPPKKKTKNKKTRFSHQKYRLIEEIR